MDLDPHRVPYARETLKVRGIEPEERRVLRRLYYQ